MELIPYFLVLSPQEGEPRRTHRLIPPPRMTDSDTALRAESLAERVFSPTLPALVCGSSRVCRPEGPGGLRSDPRALAAQRRKDREHDLVQPPHFTEEEAGT